MKLNARNINELSTLIFIAVIFFTFSTALAAEPMYVLMKFTDDTRYSSQIETADRLSEILLEKMKNSKLKNSKGFRFIETEIIDANLEARLYDEKIDELTHFDLAINSGDYNSLFEGDGFKENKAQSIVTAQVGQFITPELTAAIGRMHNADYLIQGTIINLGTGSWLSEDLEFISGAISSVARVASSQASNLLSKNLSALKFMGDIGEISVTLKGIGVQCDVRIIKASTGEVVWSKRVVGIGESKLIQVGFLKFGHEHLESRLYTKALDNAADKIVKALIADVEGNKLSMK